MNALFLYKQPFNILNFSLKILQQGSRMKWPLIEYLNNKMLSLMVHVGYEGGNFAEKYITPC